MKVLYTDEVESGFSIEFFENIASYVFLYLNIKSCNIEISLLITDNKNIQELNKTYRNKDMPTDVLSFPMDSDYMIGDIAISIDKVKEQAENAGINFDRETAFLFIHGLLHLLGYEHETSVEDEKEMFLIQETILKNLIDKNIVS